MQQIKIDFLGKKDNKITISVSDDLKHSLEQLSKALDNKEISKLAGEYVAECAGRDLGKLMLLQARGKVSINMAEL
jgi:hypothetical protein